MWDYNNTPPDDELCHYGVLGMKWGRRKTAPPTSSIKAAQKSAESEERKTDLAKKELKAQKEKLNKSNKEWGSHTIK